MTKRSASASALRYRRGSFPELSTSVGRVAAIPHGIRFDDVTTLKQRDLVVICEAGRAVPSVFGGSFGIALEYGGRKNQDAMPLLWI